MKKISYYAGESQVIVQPSVFRREYKLKFAEEVLATMDFPKYFSNNAIVEISDEKYEFKQPSIWSSEIHIYKTGQSYPFAKYESNFWRTKGEVSLSRGEKIYFKYGIFKRACEISTSSGQLLVLIKNIFSIKAQNTVEIKRQSEVLDENPWIILLGYYVILQHRRSAAAG
jgi:hypothetical protein